MVAALKILAVDDNQTISQCMRFIFGAPRYQVTVVQDGDDALAKLETNEEAYDVIIVDQKMPHLTGVQLVQEIRKRGIGGKIMVLSAHLSPEICAAYEEMDVPVILEKPFDIQQLRSVVDRLAA